MQTEANLRASQKYKHTLKGKLTKQRDEASPRGLLCSSCNKGLGHFKDNINSLKKAINYLRKNLC